MQRDETTTVGVTGFSWRRRDHTRGSLLVSLGVLALPSICTGLVGAAAYQLVDLKFVSLLWAAPLAAVVVTNQSLRQVAFLMVLGTSVGAQAVIARCVGAGKTEDADHVAGQVLLLGSLFCVVFALVGGLFPRELLGLVASDPAVLAAGVPYVRLTFILMFGFILIPLFGSILNGAGDSTTPMVVTVLAAPVSLFAEWCLIFGHLGAPAFGVTGVALGATLGSLLGLTLAGWVLLAGHSRVHLKLRHFVPDWRVIRQLLQISWQPTLHLASRTLVVVYFLALAGRFGAKVQAAYGIGIRLEMVAFMLAFPIANACATLVGQNLGAGSRRRAWRAVGVASAVSAGVCWLFAALLFLLREPLMAIFSDDPVVIAVGTEYLLFVAGSLLFMGPYFVGFRALQAAGDMTTPMLISNGSALLVALPLGHFLATATSLGPTGLWIAILVYSVVNTGATLAWLATGRWTRRRLPTPLQVQS